MAYPNVGLYALQAQNGQFVQAANGGGGGVYATANVAKEWETFLIIRRPNGASALLANNNQYLCAEGGGGGAVNANRDQPAEWETFNIMNAGGNKVRLQTWNGHWLCAVGGGGQGVSATPTVAADWETFTLVCISDFTQVSSTQWVNVTVTPNCTQDSRLAHPVPLFLGASTVGGTPHLNPPGFEGGDANQRWRLMMVHPQATPTAWKNGQLGGATVVLVNAQLGQALAAPNDDAETVLVPPNEIDQSAVWNIVMSGIYYVLRPLRNLNMNLNVKGDGPYYGGGPPALAWWWSGGKPNEIWLIYA